MAVLTKRLQVLIDVERLERLEREAARRGVPVAEVVRQAIDAALDHDPPDRRAALTRFLDGPEIEVGDWDVIKEELAGEVDRW